MSVQYCSTYVTHGTTRCFSPASDEPHWEITCGRLVVVTQDQWAPGYVLKWGSKLGKIKKIQFKTNFLHFYTT